MRKSFIIIALAAVMIFAFAGTAMADHSPQFYFNWQKGAGVIASPAFDKVFPSDWAISFNIDNGTVNVSPHKVYAQTTAKCGVCHQVHRAPTFGTGSSASPTVSSRYTVSQYTSLATPDSQLLLKSTANGSCVYCHVVGGTPVQLYGGDPAMTWVTNPDSEQSWNEFYGHTNGCTSCHAVHGAYTFPGSKILKFQGVKTLSGFINGTPGATDLVVQPETYSTNYVWAADGVQEKLPILYSSKANMQLNVVTAAAATAGVTQRTAAVTANCSVCHQNYSGANNALINFDLKNAQLFQAGSWATPNGSSLSAVWNPAAYAGPYPSAGARAGFTSGNGSWMMQYHNHPMKSAAAKFSSPGASRNALNTTVASAGSWTCQSCHDAPTEALDGTFAYQSFPHYTPGYYKFMAAQNQAAYDTPWSKATVDMGREGFYTRNAPVAGKPAVMNDGYCLKCHGNVGVTF